MITAIRHVGLVVADLEKSLKFWCDTMGFVVSRQMDESGSHIDAMMGLKDVRVTTAKLVAPDGNLIELLKFHSHPDKHAWFGAPYSTGFTHIALTIENLDELLPRLIAAGAKVPSPPQFSPDGKVKVLYVKGLENVLIELVEILEN
jgi:catechol 2,3-dioxygenase-like lactoylglutathione lyase family enzyme